MKILHIVDAVYQGGVRSLVLDIIKYQIKEGHDVSILCLMSEDKHFRTINEFEVTGVKIIRGKYKTHYNPMNIFLIKKHIENFDIVHTHHFPNQLATKIAHSLTLKKSRPILITTEHNTYNNRRKYPILKNLDKWIYKNYDKIICISTPTERNLRNWLQSKSIERNIITISNGINLKKYSEAENRLSKIITGYRDKNAKYIVMVARLRYPKDPITVLESMTYCPEYMHLVLVGDGEYDVVLNQKAKELGLSERLHLLGNRADVPHILKGCDIGVLSTAFDGFGLVAVEYMAAGLPVLISDVDGLREVVNDPDSLFKYQDSRTLGHKITKLLTDDEFRQSKINYSLLRCNQFSAEKMNRGYMAVYDELLGKRK